MKKLSLLLVVIFIAIIGGFIIGIGINNLNKQSQMVDAPSMNNQVPQSSPEPEHKPVPKPESLKPRIAKPKVLIGYVQDFRDPNQIDYDKLTHVIFSFVHPTVDGGILFSGDYAIKNLRTIVSEAKKHDTKVILAIGGWFHINGGESYGYFKKAISTPVSRKKLVNEIVRLVEREKLDGIDIDFEHPRSNEDARNLADFAKKLNAMLQPRNKELSIAVNAKVHSVTGIEIQSVLFDPSMFKYFDHVNLMAYDGQWDGEYNAANLSTYKYSENILNYWTNLFDEYGHSRNKLVLGVPLYAQPENPSIKQVSYEVLIKNNPANVNRDTVNMNGTTYHYNSHLTMQKKTRLAIDYQLGGMMLWETGLDAKGANSVTRLISEVLESTSNEEKYYTTK